MSKDYDVAVRWHLDGTTQDTTVQVNAPASATALKLARRAIFLDHPGAGIDKAEIVYLEKPDAIPVTLGSAESRATTQRAIKRSQRPAAEEPERTCTLTGAEAENPEDCTTHEHETDNGTVSERPVLGVGEYGRSSTLIAQIAERFGTTAVTSFLDSMDEFMESNRSKEWRGTRLFIKVAKIEQLKRKAA